MQQAPLLSIIIPVFNEEKNIPLFVHSAITVLHPTLYRYEFIFINDGSTDNSVAVIERTQKELEQAQLKDTNTKLNKKFSILLIDFSRNFGKEAATTAGLAHAQGLSAIVLDADLQHPIELLPHFIEKWETGSEVVIGVRNRSKSDGMVKRVGSKVFYKILKRISHATVIPGATDYRLLDRIVIDEFNSLSEHNRMTRGLIDWLGFKRSYIFFDAKERMHGSPSYTIPKLVRLATSSFVSTSLMPLRVAGYLGGSITVISGLLGIVIFCDRYITEWGFSFSGPAILAVIILFLIGIVLVCIGMIAVYIGSIYHEVQNRPLYIVRKK